MVHAVALPATSAPTVPVMETAQTVALASDAATRAAREQTLRVQAQLRARASAEQQASHAARNGSGNERCIAGQKMRRVANGWVQAGAC